MLTCRLCGCNCYSSNLIGMVCNDCREKERKERENKEKSDRLIKAECRQLELEYMNYESL